MLRILFSFAFLLPGAGQASGPDQFGQFGIFCRFDELPDLTAHYSPGPTGQTGAMTIGGRGPAVMTIGQGSGRAETATIDGYTFIFWPQSNNLDIERGGRQVAQARGQCQQISFGANQPLRLD